MNTEVKSGGAWHARHFRNHTKSRWSWGALFHVTMLILGMACIGWALVNIWYNSSISNDSVAYVSFSGAPSGAPVEAGGLTNPVSPKPVSVEVRSAIGDLIGSLWIPALDKRVPVYQGTKAAQLKKGAGHYVQSVMPGKTDNCVISGHRDTVFSGLGKLVVGDLLIVEDPTGTFTYAITGTRIVDKDDKTVIVPMDHGVLTLTTCYPFLYIGSAPDRYIVSADLIKSEASNSFMSGDAK